MAGSNPKKINKYQSEQENSCTRAFIRTASLVLNEWLSPHRLYDCSKSAVKMLLAVRIFVHGCVRFVKSFFNIICCLRRSKKYAQLQVRLVPNGR